MNLLSFFGKAFKYGDFINYFRLGFLRLLAKTADTLKRYADAPRELDGNHLQQLLMASGAIWANNGNGNWHFLYPRNTKAHPFVCEFLEYFGAMRRVGVDKGVDHVVLIEKGLASLVELGFPIRMEYFNDPGEGEHCDGDGKALPDIPGHNSNTIGEQRE